MKRDWCRGAPRGDAHSRRTGSRRRRRLRPRRRAAAGQRSRRRGGRVPRAPEGAAVARRGAVQSRRRARAARTLRRGDRRVSRRARRSIRRSDGPPESRRSRSTRPPLRRRRHRAGAVRPRQPDNLQARFSRPTVSCAWARRSGDRAARADRAEARQDDLALAYMLGLAYLQEKELELGQRAGRSHPQAASRRKRT